LEKGNSLLFMHQPSQAETTFRAVLKELPDNTIAQLGLAKSLLLQGESQESYQILKRFPASREYNASQSLLPLAIALSDLDAERLKEEDPLDPAYNRAIRLIKRGNIEAAMDGLLDILRENKHYADGQARLILVALFELLGEDNPLTRQYRAELASVLF
jgi:putative thioredoxin